ncbi:hypothetical protein [Planococcus sp. CAU13]|uniref:hypothetical protein n=1 Tax=Planococcus sp. CAU13 TaxID=1541197 RepID=UPI00052FF0A8|nr:hypothetical protein [Planococcus sp. CAU13]
MVVDVILGFNIDTAMWISDLRLNGANEIVVLDYDYFGESKLRDGVLYFSTFEIKNYLMKFDTINYYKSMYGFPGMGGKMSTFYRSI